MRLLVSVSSAAEASAALAGGADIIDAKNPLAGALGPVSLEVLREIYAVVAGTRPVTAALGDAANDSDVERDACAFAAAGARFVKVGFAGISSPGASSRFVAAAVRGAALGSDGAASVVAVAYADADRVGSLPASSFVQLAARAGARGRLARHRRQVRTRPPRTHRCRTRLPAGSPTPTTRGSSSRWPGS